MRISRASGQFLERELCDMWLVDARCMKIKRKIKSGKEISAYTSPIGSRKSIGNICM